TYFNSPYWLDNFVHDFSNMLELRIKVNVIEKQLQLLTTALQRITQRKNLFEKVLIPKATMVIRAIQIFLADHERAAVVLSKMTKKKR
ncbi:MAG: V-type ATP synthase subunit D, partial [Bacteriovoracales bacterium]